MGRRILFLSLTLLLASKGLCVSLESKLVVIVSSAGDNLPLSGAEVTIDSEKLMGAISRITDKNGTAIFLGIPAGEYSVRIFKEGFNSAERSRLVIGINRTLKIELLLVPRDAESAIDGNPDKITDVADVSLSSGNVFEFDQILHYLPIPRNLVSLLMYAGGIDGREYVSVLGSGAFDNIYNIDGINHLDPHDQDMSGQFSIDSVEAMDVLLTGLPAEYGFITGGVVEAVTGSGSNRFHLTGQLILRRNEWNDVSQNNPATAGDDIREGLSDDSITFDAGGFLIEDTAWWFLSYESLYQSVDVMLRMNPLDPQEETVGRRYIEGNYIGFKVTLQPLDTLNAVMVYKKDPTTTFNNGYGRQKMQPSAESAIQKGGEIICFQLGFSASDNLLLEGSWSSLNIKNNQVPQSGTSTTGVAFYSEDGWYWGAIPYIGRQEKESDVINVSINYVWRESFIGFQDVELGFELQENKSAISRTIVPSNEQIETGKVEGVGFDNAAWTSRLVYENRLPAAKNRNSSQSVFIQDCIQLSESLTFNVGLRADASTLYNNVDEDVYKNSLFETLAPRVGFTYDFSGNTLKGAYCRYYDTLWLYLATDFDLYSSSETIYDYVPADGVDGRNGWVLRNVSYRGQSYTLNAVDPELTPQYCDEFSLGFDWEVSEFIKIGVLGAYRVYRDLVLAKDLNTDGINTWRNIETDKYGNKWKTWIGAILSFRKRPSSDNLFLSAELSFCRQEFLMSSNSVWNEYLINPITGPSDAGSWWGISEEPTIQYNLQGSYIFPNNWYIGLTLMGNNGGKPSTKNSKEVPGFGSFTYLPYGRGNLERLPDTLQINLQFGISQVLELPFNVPFTGNEIEFTIYANINNLTNRQQPLAVVTNEKSKNYLEPTDWLRARWYQLGLRLEL